MDISVEKKRYFLAQAPGDVNWLLIPVTMRDQFIEWCKCELYDEEYTKYRNVFYPYLLVDGKNNHWEFIIV
jgi:hypothetical protein